MMNTSICSKFISLLLICIVNGESNGKDATAHSTEVGVGCFSSDSIVSLDTDEQISIDQLKIGNSIKTIENKNLTITEMILILDQQKFHQAKFYTFKTLSGHKISLTRDHLIAVHSMNNEQIFRSAFQINVGDLLYVWIDNHVEFSPIIQIEIETKIGYYAPLTMSGTILVNQILASCFSSIQNHHLAQFYLFPIRWYYQLNRLLFLQKLSNETEIDGIHWFIDILYRILLFFRHFSIELI